MGTKEGSEPMTQKADKRTNTIRDVAKAANVSITTVSRYINGKVKVKAATAEKIDQAIKTTQYAPSIAAQSMRKKASRIILLAVPDICNPFYSQMAKTVQELLSYRGYVMALVDTHESTHDEQAIRVARQMYAQGILIASIDMKEDVIRQALGLKIPIVGLNAFTECPFDTVHVNGAEGTYLATRHLIALGHTRIGFAGGAPRTVIEDSRREGYERAMCEAGLPVLPELVKEIGFSQMDGYELGRYFAQTTTDHSAVCCANDQIAMGLLNALTERGIKVPERVSVTGMDDIPYAKIANPSLTSVTNDSDFFAREGVKMLFERIEGVASGAPRNIFVRHELIVRNSVGAVRKG